jgi:hypothetical protein
MKTSLWLNVDPLTAEMPNYGAYVYTFNNPVRFTDPTGMIAEPPTGVDAEDGAIHTDSSGSWKYDKASTTWKGQDGSKDIGNTIELDNVNIKGYKSNYVSSGEYGPSYGREKDLQYSLMLVGAIAAPIVAVEGGIAAGGAYLWSEGVAAFSAITTETAITEMGINTLSQYIANGGNAGDINMIEVGSSAIPGLGPIVFGETFSYSFNNVLDGKFIQAPDFSSSKGWKNWGVQVGGGIISNRFGNATDNYLLNEGIGGKIVGGYFTGLIETGSNAAPGLIK